MCHLNRIETKSIVLTDLHGLAYVEINLLCFSMSRDKLYIPVAEYVGAIPCDDPNLFHLCIHVRIYRIYIVVPHVTDSVPIKKKIRFLLVFQSKYSQPNHLSRKIPMDIHGNSTYELS